MTSTAELLNRLRHFVRAEAETQYAPVEYEEDQPAAPAGRRVVREPRGARPQAGIAPPKPAATPAYPAPAPARRKPAAPTPMPDFVTASFGIKSPLPPPKPKEEKPKADVSGVAVGVTVHHKTFGPGKVIELNKGLITIAFEQGEKRFEFPSAFDNGFLKV